MNLLGTLFGRRLKTEEAEAQHVGILQGVPILGLDALGSASYGPEAALTILIPLGAVGLLYMRGVVAVILVLLAILTFSYRQTIAAYPNGGGSYVVARQNLGTGAGLVAAASLLLDYVLNVAVGISAGVGALESAVPALQAHTLAACLAVLAVVTFVNLRGVRDSGLAWALPTYIFVGSLFYVLALGIWKTLHSGGHPPPLVAPPALSAATAAASGWLILRAFASGCTAMTGVEAVGNAVPIFKKPAAKNAQRSLVLICTILGMLLAGIGYLAHSYQLGAMDQQKPGYQSVISQLVSAVAGRGVLYYITIGSVLAVLTLSANTSFAGFPRLCRLLAEDSYLPSAFANLGRRLVYSLGIAVLALLAGTLLIVFNGITDKLIPLFAVGAFGAFTLSQAGMVMHWRREGKGVRNLSFWVNALGAGSTGAAWVIILVAKFLEGAWVTVIAIPVTIALFVSISRHYAYVARAISPPLELQTWKLRRLKVILPVDGWSCVTERALRFALRISDDIIAVHITPEETNKELIQTWRDCVQAPALKAGLAQPQLEVIHSPYRQLYKPLLEFVDAAKKEFPDRLIAIIIPELVQPRWWEYLLHNHVAEGLKAVLLLGGDERVVVINTPWYLRRS